ncbi:uncharacterized protein [Dysidea avara]|uniref:uncharacterized protein isoform X2 n=1 Tax=Dysidea avara TaxID=196820 RepID=UPI0033315CF7
MSLFKKFKRKGNQDEKNKVESNLNNSPGSPTSGSVTTEPVLSDKSTESPSRVKRFAPPTRPMNYTLEKTTLFEGLNVTGVVTSNEKDTDSQGSADTSRSQHTDVTSEVSSVHDKIDGNQANQSDHSDGEEKGSSFSFVRSDSVQSKGEDSSGDEDQPKFSFIKDNANSDDIPQGHNSGNTTENIKPELFIGKAASEGVESRHSSRVKSPPTELLVAPSVKEPALTQAPPGLQATPKSSVSDNTNPSSISAPASVQTIGKVTPTATVTKSAAAKKKRTGKAKRPGQWKHEEAPLDEIQMVKEYHHTHSLVDLKEPLNDIPEGNEDVTTPSEDKILDVPELNISNIPIPMIQVEITDDDDVSTNVVPEINVVLDDTTAESADSVTLNGTSATELVSEVTSTKMDNNSSNDELNSVLQPATASSHETSTSDAQESGHNKTDLLSEQTATEADPQQKATDYGIKLSHEDQITLLLQTTDSKLNDIRTSCEGVVATSNKSISDHVATVMMRIEKRKEYHRLREQEAVCLSEENYELAEQLGAKMESLSLELECKLDNASTEVHSYTTEQFRVLEEERQLRNQVVEKLTVLKSDEEYKLEKVSKDFSVLQTKEKKKIATIEDHIKREKGYIGLDREHVEKAEASYMSERDERCAEFLTKKKSLSEEMSSLQEQISEMEKQLALLRQKETVLLSALSEEDSKVKSIEDEMSVEKQQIDVEWEKIHKRESELQVDISELDTNKSNYEKVEEEHNGIQQCHQKSIDTLQNWVNTHCDRLKQLDQFGEVLQCCCGKLTATDRVASPELNKLDEEKRTMDGQVKELTAKVLSVQTQMSQLQKSINDINSRVPQLNEAKKAAVAGRQYREAGQISQQIKSLTQQLEDEQQQMSTLQSQLSTHTTQLSSLNQQVSKMDDQLVTFKKENDIALLQGLFKQCKQLIKEAISDHGIPGLVNFLKSYCKLCSVLADELCTKYSLELSDLELEDISELATTDIAARGTDELPNGDSVADGGNDNINTSTAHHTTEHAPTHTSSKQEELELEIASVESQLSEAVIAESFDEAATLYDRLKLLKESLSQL